MGRKGKHDGKANGEEEKGRNQPEGQKLAVGLGKEGKEAQGEERLCGVRVMV